MLETKRRKEIRRLLNQPTKPKTNQQSTLGNGSFIFQWKRAPRATSALKVGAPSLTRADTFAPASAAHLIAAGRLNYNQAEKRSQTDSNPGRLKAQRQDEENLKGTSSRTLGRSSTQTSPTREECSSASCWMVLTGVPASDAALEPEGDTGSGGAIRPTGEPDASPSGPGARTGEAGGVGVGTTTDGAVARGDRLAGRAPTEGGVS